MMASCLDQIRSGCGYGYAAKHNSHMNQLIELCTSGLTYWLMEQEVPAAKDTDGWKEAAIAWEVCRSIHERFAKGKDALYTTRQGDFKKHHEDARTKALKETT